MKFLSVFILGAAVLATSCTKDLEDRMDKVEETLATVVKNVADLEKALNDLPKVGDVSLATTTENGKQVLVFKVPGKADTKITIDIPAFPADNNDAANVTITPDAPTKGRTQVTIKTPEGDKNFDYPTTFPSNVTSIVTLTEGHTVAVGGTFTVNFKFNTNDGEAVGVIDPSAITPLVGFTTKASAFEPTKDFTVKSVNAVEGSLNEYEITFEAVLNNGAQSNYRFNLTQPTNVITSDFFDVTIGDAPVITNISVGLPAADLATGLIAFTAGATPVIATISSTSTLPALKAEEYFFKGGAVNVANRINHGSIVGQEYKIFKCADVADLMAVVGANGLSLSTDKTGFDAIMKKINDESAKTTGSKLVAADDHIAITDAKGVLTITPDYTKIADNQSKYFVVMTGRVAGANYFVVGGIVVINKTAVLPNAIPFISTLGGKSVVFDAATGTVPGTDLAAGEVFKVENMLYTVANYTALTTLPTLDNNVSSTYVDVYDAVTGEKMNKTANGITPGVNEHNFFKYSFTLTKDLKLVAGNTYNVDIKHVYTASGEGEKFFVIRHVLTAGKPASVLAATPADAFAGYSFATDMLTYKSFAAYASAADATAKKLIDFTANTNEAQNITIATGMKTTITSVVGAAGAATDYQIFYRVKTTKDAAVVYLDGLGATDALLQTATPVGVYKVAEKEVIDAVATNNRLEQDKEYAMDVVVLFSDGNKTIIPAKVIFSTVKITGFKTAAESQDVITTFNRDIKVDGTTKVDLSYVMNGGTVKPFFFAANTTPKNSTALWLTETSPADGNPFIKVLAGIKYTVKPLTAEQKATIKNGANALSTVEATALTSLVEFNGAITNTEKSLSSGDALAAGALTINKTANGLLTNYVLTTDLVQTIVVESTDYLGRIVEKEITVTIKK